jgi:phosphoribosylformylglycinamidine cyclo-ligase
VSEPTELSYSAAGVDRDAANRAKDRILDLVRGTATPGVVPNIGGFGGLFRAPAGFRSPVLVASADGVGTKLKVAARAGRHTGVGHDIVNHCANDILVEGAQPLFFLDYLGMGRLEPGVVEDIVGGVAAGCREIGCALLGGETAEMPDVYADGEYDLAGFIVGVVEENSRPGSHRVEDGDVLIGLASDGFHTNGYSLLRKLLFEHLGLECSDRFPGTDRSVEDVLLQPHRAYGPALVPLLDTGVLHALAHITGGGILENLDRVMPPGLGANVRLDTWQLPPEFRAVASLGHIEEREMYRTFNMGVGMIAVAAASDAERVVGRLTESGETAWILGTVVAADEKVILSADGPGR